MQFLYVQLAYYIKQEREWHPELTDEHQGSFESRSHCHGWISANIINDIVLNVLLSEMAVQAV